MTNPEEIKRLAWQRLKEAEVLYKNELYDGAFYLAGYSVELMLKAKICESLGIPNLFDEESSIEGIGEIRKHLKTHNILHLLIHSRLKVKLDEDKANDKNLTKAISLLLNSWNENVRYKPCGHFLVKDVEKMINLLSGPNGLLKWIEES